LNISTYQALYGQKPPMVGEALIPANLLEGFRNRAQARAALIDSVKASLDKAQACTKYFADVKRSERTLQVGDMAYLKVQPYRHNALGMHSSFKLHSCYYGPFIVIDKISSEAH
jgi:hypothetical protein